MSDWLTLKEAGDAKGITYQSVSAWVARGHFAESDIQRDEDGRPLRLRATAVDAVSGYRRDPRFATGEFVRIPTAAQMLDMGVTTVLRHIDRFGIPVQYAPNQRDKYLLREDAETLYELVERQRSEAEITLIQQGSEILEAESGREIISTVCKAIEGGFTIGPAASLAGVSKGTLERWISEGRYRRSVGVAQDEDIFVDLVNSLDDSLSRAEARLIQGMENAGRTDWQQWRYRLERQHPHWRDDGKSKPGVNVSVNQQVAQQVDQENTQQVAIKNETRALSIDDILKKKPELAGMLSEIAEALEADDDAGK